jgi:hypothetical protein
MQDIVNLIWYVKANQNLREPGAKGSIGNLKSPSVASGATLRSLLAPSTARREFYGLRVSVPL